MNGAVGEKQRRCQIIGHSLRAEIRQYRKVHAAIRICKLAPDRAAGLVDTRDRTVEELRGFEDPEWGFRHLDFGAGPPDKTATHDLRMQSAHEHRDPPQRDTASDEPVGQLGQYLLRQRSRPGAVDQPVNNRSDLARSASRSN